MDKDVPTLKHDLRLRILFAVVFAMTFIWQFIMLIIASDSATTLMIVASCATMIFSIMFSFTSTLYAIKDLTIKLLENHLI